MIVDEGKEAIVSFSDGLSRVLGNLQGIPPVYELAVSLEYNSPGPLENSP